MILNSGMRETNRRGFGRAVVATIVLAGALMASEAHAQPGEHIRAGQALITPKVSLGVEYSTNVYHSEDSPIGGTSLRFAPGLEIGGEGPSLAVTFNGEYELHKYFQPALVNLDRYDDFQLGLKVDALKDRTIGFRFDDTAGQRNYPAEATFAERPYEAQLRNDMHGAIAIRPGAAIEVAVGGKWAFSAFRVASGDTAAERLFNRQNAYGPELNAQWNFFPRTALVLEGSYEWHEWSENWIGGFSSSSASPNDIGSYLGVPDSTQLRVLAGMRGRVTQKLVLVAEAGYGSGNYDEQSVLDAASGTTDADPSETDPTTAGFAADITGLDRLLVDLQARYEPDKNNSFILGYQKDFRDAFFTNYNAFHYGYGRLNNRFNERFGLVGELGARAERYRGEVERNDVFLNAQGDFSYYLQDWATVSAGAAWTQRGSSDPQVNYNDITFRLLTNIVY